MEHLIVEIMVANTDGYMIGDLDTGMCYLTYISFKGNQNILVDVG